METVTKHTTNYEWVSWTTLVIGASIGAGIIGYILYQVYLTGYVEGHLSGHNEGYETGYEDGFNSGLDQGYQDLVPVSPSFGSQALHSYSETLYITNIHVGIFILLLAIVVYLLVKRKLIKRIFNKKN